MVEDRITDGKRIAQLLASELTGLSTGPADRLDVEDADPDAEPSAEGTYAYAISWDGNRVGEVFVHERVARIDLSDGDTAGGGPPAGLAVNIGDNEVDADVTEAEGISLTMADGSPRITVEYAAAVKRAVDVLVELLEKR